MPDPSTSRRARILAGSMLAVVTLVAFWPALDNGFVNMDDPKYVVENRHVQQGLTPESLRWAWTTAHASNWHPVTWISHMLDWQLFGPAPRGHHATNLVLHLANTLLLFVLLDRLTGAPGRSVFVAALFAVHPLHVESVAWVAERKDVLSTFLGLLTILAYVRYVRNRTTSSYLLVLFGLALGLAAKPMLVTLPIVLGLLDYWPLGRWGRERPWRLVREKLPFLALSVASSFVTLWAQHSGQALRSFSDYPLPVRLSNAVVAYAAYLVKTVWPAGLGVYYPHPRELLPLWQVGGSALLLLVVTGLAIRSRQTRPWILVGWLWYVVTLVPVIGVVQVGGQAMADRYTYVPLVGIFVVVAWSVGLVKTGNGVRVSAAAIVILLLVALTRGQVGYWRDSETLFRRVLQVSEGSPTVHLNLGAALGAQERHAEAAEHYAAALRLNPRNAKAHNNLGNALRYQGRPDEAYEHFAEALRLDPGYANAHYNYGVTLASEGRLEEAIGRYRQALRLDPAHAQAHNNLGNALAREGKLDDAMAHFSTAIRLKPGYARAHANLATALFYGGRYREAWIEIQRARRHGFEPPAALIESLTAEMPEP